LTTYHLLVQTGSCWIPELI